MTNAQLKTDAQWKGLVVSRVPASQIDALEAGVTYVFFVHGTTTFCHAFLNDKTFLATGHAISVADGPFNEELGRKVAYNDVQKPMRDKLWELEGYALYKSQKENK